MFYAPSMSENTTNINLRVSRDEKSLVLIAANRKRLTVSQYVRQRLGLKAKEGK